MTICNSHWGLWNLDDRQWISGPKRFGRNGLPGGPALERRARTMNVMMITITATTTAAIAVHDQIVGRHLNGHNVMGERPNHLSELVDFVAQVPDTSVTLVEPVLQSGNVVVFLPRLGHPAFQLALQVPQPVHHGRTHRVCGRCVTRGSVATDGAISLNYIFVPSFTHVYRGECYFILYSCSVVSDASNRLSCTRDGALLRLRVPCVQYYVISPPLSRRAQTAAATQPGQGSVKRWSISIPRAATGWPTRSSGRNEPRKPAAGIIEHNNITNLCGVKNRYYQRRCQLYTGISKWVDGRSRGSGDENSWYGPTAIAEMMI